MNFEYPFFETVNTAKVLICPGMLAGREIAYLAQAVGHVSVFWLKNCFTLYATEGE